MEARIGKGKEIKLREKTHLLRILVQDFQASLKHDVAEVGLLIVDHEIFNVELDNHNLLTSCWSITLRQTGLFFPPDQQKSRLIKKRRY